MDSRMQEDALIVGVRSWQRAKMLMKTSEQRKDIANAKTTLFWAFRARPALERYHDTAR